ncbi:hypothetical protein SAMN04487996_12687 [Dyadobacter soli]|uniref:Uncharacterized protein n=1 Tax=Dyadobacter soli TaxID=659014 RepID=A0A1G7YQ35_9BACT|nr:hypothetical protein [Dyadobacter soli]SDG98385.1 hypothetical protein SAMN04487996_12687 [Dyadobacter soli]
MKEKFYPFEASEDYMYFWFESKSENRVVAKSVEFSKLGAQTYNLAFGDVDENDDLDDVVVSNNGDMPKVLATIAQIVIAFLGEYNDKHIYFTGSSRARTRLYRAVLTREIDNWSPIFEIRGVYDGRAIPFQSNIDFESFIIKRKN